MKETKMNVRLLTISEAAAYTGRGETKCKKWLREIGAVRHFGRTVRYDIKTIDEALDAMAREEALKIDRANK